MAHVQLWIKDKGGEAVLGNNPDLATISAYYLT